MHTLPGLLSTVALATLLVACGSTPKSNHYVLSANNSGTPDGDTPALGIGPIDIPEYLKRNGLVYNREGNQLQITETERWAEPLEDGIARVITLNLASLLNTQDVRPFPWHPKRPPDYGIKVRIVTMNANDREASLAAEWLVYRAADAEPLVRRISRLQHTMPEGELQAADIAPAYSVLMFQLSELIAAAIREDSAGS